jgi:hypothetical protein
MACRYNTEREIGEILQKGEIICGKATLEGGLIRNMHRMALPMKNNSCVLFSQFSQRVWL